MRILLFGTYDERTHPRVRVLREGLEETGFEPDVCNRPLGLGTADRVHIAQRPWLAPVFAVRVLTAWAWLWRAAAPRRPDVVIVGYLGHLDVHLARMRFRGAVVVLDHMVGLADTVRDRQVGGGLLSRVLGLVDHAAAQAADVVVVDTDEQGSRLSGTAGDRVLVIPVGADRQWYQARRPLAAIDGEPLRVVFFGLYTPLQGAPVIAEALRALPGLALTCTMVGTGQDRPAVERLVGGDPRVVWLDWVEAEDLPDLVASHHVCLGIFGTGAKARRVVPNKVYQGAAAGCAVVTSDTPCQRRLLDGHALMVPPGDAHALAEALDGLAGSAERTAQLRAAAATLADRAFTPSAVVDPLVERLQSLR